MKKFIVLLILFLNLNISIYCQIKNIDNSSDIKKLNDRINILDNNYNDHQKELILLNETINKSLTLTNNFFVSISIILAVITFFIMIFSSLSIIYINKILDKTNKAKDDSEKLKNEIIKINDDTYNNINKIYQNIKIEELKDILKILNKYPNEIYNYRSSFNFTFSYDFFDQFKNILKKITTPEKINNNNILIEIYLNILLLIYAEKAFFDDFIHDIFLQRINLLVMLQINDNEHFLLLEKIVNKYKEKGKPLESEFKKILPDIKNKFKEDKPKNDKIEEWLALA
jgi:hypothetical protein